MGKKASKIVTLIFAQALKFPGGHLNQHGWLTWDLFSDKVSSMKNSIVTGASSGIGRECALMLLQNGFRVFGISRDFLKCAIEHENFIPCCCDLTDMKALCTMAADIRKRTRRSLDLLLNCAGTGYFAPHEELEPHAIHNMVALNLEAPVLLSSLLLRDIKNNRGFIINIASITAQYPAPRGCAYGATKAGLLHFSRSLFEETRRSGVKVVCIMPDLTRTPFFDNLDFEPDDNAEAFIEPECIARAVREIITQRTGTVITELVIRPQRLILKKKAAPG